jgi:5-hydroxyisourate hydrolase-like protein (transthyretin family)
VQVGSAFSWLRQHRRPLAKLAIVIGLLLCAGAVWWINAMPDRVDDQQTVVLGQTQFAPGMPASLRILVRDLSSEQPIQGAQVQVALRPKAGGARQVLFTGQMDQFGTADVRFKVPEDAPAESKLIVETKSRVGRDRIEKPVQVAREFKIFLTTDKPVYQPGQVIHMRALVLGAQDLKPANQQSIQLVVEDAKGNKVFRRSVDTSEYGVASADFQLAEEVNQGQYKIAAEHGDTVSEKTVTVKWYVLPKFKVDVTTDKAFYLPDQVVQGHVQADYFFGKPVADGQVKVVGATYDVVRQQVAEIRGETDANGGFDFTIEVPDYLVGGAPEKETATYTLEVTVVDQAEHAEQTTQDLPVAREAILIDAVPESGQLRPGLENIVYIMTSYPDGTPAQTVMQVVFRGQKQELATGEHGVAELRLRPGMWIWIYAHDAAGQSASKAFELETDAGVEQVLLRPDRPTYRVGDTMHVEAFVTGWSRTVYLDIVREGQTLLTRATDVQDGKAAFDVDLSPDLFGTLELHTYQVQRDGSIVRDTRIVVVNAPMDVEVAMTADKEVYQPGEVARLAFQLSRQGQPVQGALGISIVDESVFSVEEQDPGFARLYFLLEAELLKPRYQIKQTLEPELLQPLMPPERAAPARLDPQQQASAQAALAVAPAADFALRVNSQAEKIEATLRQQARSFSDLGNILVITLACLPLVITGIVWRTLRRRGVLSQALRPFWITIAVLFLGSVIILPIVAVILYLLFEALQSGAVMLLALAWLACLVILGAYAVRKRDDPVQFIVLLILACAALFPLMAYATQKGGFSNMGLLISLALTYLLGVAAIYLLGLGLRRQGEKQAAWAAILLAALTIPTVVLLVTIPAFATSPVVQALGVPTVYTMPMGLLMGCAPATPQVIVVEKVVEKEEEAKAPGLAAAQEPPRLRQYFPETLYWNPEAITDESGRLALDVPMADSITTWRLSAQASTKQGELGGLTTGLRVFQDFFIDLDLPVALTQNDEIAVPVSVFNYLAQEQSVRLELTPEDWFELLDTPSKEVTIQSNDVGVVYFRIKARNFGRHKLTVTAWGQRMSDAIAKEVRVVPDGKEIRRTHSNWLEDGTKGVVRIPATAIPGTAKVMVKVYPGLLSQVVEGLDGLLRMPFG